MTSRTVYAKTAARVARSAANRVAVRYSTAVHVPLNLAALLFVIGCAGAGDRGPGDDTGEGSDTSCELVDAVAGPKDTGAGPRAARTLDGTITWAVDFDASAEALGYHDCAYTRDYNHFVERTDLGWLCPDCTLLTEGAAAIVSGYEDCYAQVSDADAERVEQVGLVEGEGDTRVWRTGTQNVRLAELGPLVDGAVAFSDAGEIEDVGGYTVTGAGDFVEGEVDGTVDDLDGARSEPYTCGWPLFSPGGPTESYEAAVGAVLPNARLEDTCAERVDLWDFRGRYVVIDASSPNCGPCQEMARRADAFKAEMADLCVDVEMITLLNAGLSEVNLPASAPTLDAWHLQFGLSSPVLADAGYGYGVLAPALNPDGGMGLPSIAILDPEGRVIYMDTGFGETSGYFDPMRDAILADQGASAAE